MQSVSVNSLTNRHIKKGKEKSRMKVEDHPPAMEGLLHVEDVSLLQIEENNNPGIYLIGPCSFSIRP